MKKLIVLLLFLAQSQFLFSVDYSKLTLNRNIEKYKLPNGLTVILKPEHSNPLTGLAVLYHVGFRNEQKGKSGLTHLLEHMMFKGTKRYGKGQIAKTLHELGAHFNAFTTYDKTVYWEVLPAEGLKTAMDIEADRMQNSLLDPKEFEKEKQVVLSELNMHEGNPMVQLRHKLYRKAFGDHPFAYDYGLINDVKNGSRDYVYHELYKKYYVPNNAVVVVVGNFKTAQVKKWIKKYFGPLKKNPNLPAMKPNPIRWKLGAKVSIEGVASDDFGNILFKLPATDIYNKDYLALSLIEWSGMLSGFYYWDTPDGGVGYYNYAKDPDYPAETLSKDYIRKNLADFKARLLNRERMDYDSVSSILMSLVWLESKCGAEHYLDLLRGMEGVTANQVIAVVQKYLRRKNSVSGFFKAKHRSRRAKPSSSVILGESFGRGGNDTDLEKYTPKQLAKVQKIVNAKSVQTLANLRDYLSKVKVMKLSNGVTLIYRRVSLNDKVNIQIGLLAGTVYQKKPYQAAWTKYFVMDGGPQTVIYNQLVKKGVQVGSSINKNTATMSIEAPSEDLSRALKMAGLAFKNRRFMDLVLEEQKANALNALKKEKDNPSPAFHAYKKLSTLIHGHAGEGLDHSVTPGNVLGIKLKDIEDFYHSAYRPEKTVIVVAGNVDYQTVVRAVRQNFGGWNAGSALLKLKEAGLQTPTANKEYHVKVPNSQQSVVLMAAPTVSYSDVTNYLTYLLANDIFGGSGLSSRLMRHIRDKEGLTYGIYTFPRPYGDKNVFRVYMQNDPKNTGKAIKMYFDELNDYVKNGPTDMEIAKDKLATFNSEVFSFENAKSIASKLLYYQLRRGKYDFDLDYLGILSGISKKQLVAVVRKYFPKKMFIVIAGQ